MSIIAVTYIVTLQGGAIKFNLFLTFSKRFFWQARRPTARQSGELRCSTTVPARKTSRRRRRRRRTSFVAERPTRHETSSGTNIIKLVNVLYVAIWLYPIVDYPWEWVLFHLSGSTQLGKLPTFPLRLDPGGNVSPLTRQADVFPTVRISSFQASRELTLTVFPSRPNSVD
jgi:hypothetical protein